MTAPVINLRQERSARRDAELRAQFDIRPGDHWQPVGLLVRKIVDDARVQMAERRNREAQR